MTEFHLTPAECLEYARGSLSPERQEAVERHLDVCDDCAARAGALLESSELPLTAPGADDAAPAWVREFAARALRARIPRLAELLESAEHDVRELARLTLSECRRSGDPEVAALAAAALDERASPSSRRSIEIDPSLLELASSLVACALHPGALGELGQMLSEDLGLATEAGLPLARQVTLSLGNNPVGFDMRRLYRTGHGEVPDAKLYRMWDLWLVCQRFSVLESEGPFEVRGVEYESEFEGASAVVVGVLPQREFADPNRPGVFRACLEADGVFGAAAELPADGWKGRGLVPGVRFALSDRPLVVGDLEVDGISSHVSVTGRGTTHPHWYFDAAGRRLRGVQNVLGLVLVEPDTEELRFRIRGSVLVSSPAFRAAQMYSTEWVEARCRLGPITASEP